MSKYDFTNIENQIDMTESQLEDEINRYRGQSNKTSTLLTIFGILFRNYILYCTNDCV